MSVELADSNNFNSRHSAYEDYAKLKGFNDMQLYQIKCGFTSGVDVTKYTQPVYTWKQMQYLRWGLENGLDIVSYNTIKFSAYQMHLIYKGELVGLKVHNYADPELSWSDMKVAMENEIYTLCRLYNLDAEQSTELFMAIESGHHINNFLDHGYSGEEMRLIRLKLNKEKADQITNNEIS